MDARAATLVERAGEARRRDASRVVKLDGAEYFIHVRSPSRRLVIVGAVHVAQALAPMAKLNGFQVVLVDPREAFATAFYVGALGSRKSHAARLERLAQKDVPRELLARIRGPVGLPIGAVTTAEIATSIIADIVRTMRLDGA